MRALLVSLLVPSLALLPTAATATTFTDVTIEDLARASDLVVIGRVEHVDVHPHGPAGQPGIHTRAVIQVAETLRGEHRTIVEVWVHGGRIGNRMRVVPGQATFRVGEDVALFLFDAGGGIWPTGMGRGKWSIQPGSLPVLPDNADRLRLVSGAGTSLEELRTAVASAGAAERRP